MRDQKTGGKRLDCRSRDYSPPVMSVIAGLGSASILST
jgi:hypothetical protein